MCNSIPNIFKGILVGVISFVVIFYIATKIIKPVYRSLGFDCTEIPVAIVGILVLSFMYVGMRWASGAHPRRSSIL